MSDRGVSTAAMLAAPAALPSSRRHQHCSAEEWRAYVEKDGGNRQYQLMKVRFRGLAKNTAHVITLFALSNLWMARRRLLAMTG